MKLKVLQMQIIDLQCIVFQLHFPSLCKIVQKQKKCVESTHFFTLC